MDYIQRTTYSGSEVSAELHPPKSAFCLKFVNITNLRELNCALRIPQMDTETIPVPNTEWTLKSNSLTELCNDLQLDVPPFYRTRIPSSAYQRN